MKDFFGSGTAFVNQNTKSFFGYFLRTGSTRNILRRKSMYLYSYNCVLCQLNVEESVTHLFLDCPFARSCWSCFNIFLNQDSQFPEAILEVKSQVSSQFFMILVILLCWAIWTARNDHIFKNIPASVTAVRKVVLSELNLLTVRARSKDSRLF